MIDRRALRIAVVDDSVVVRRLISQVLSGDPGIGEVRTASDGQAGVALVKEMKPDLVTMDIEMPVMGGIEAVRRIRSFDPRVPIIMFSTLTEAGAVATLDAFSAGATDFVTKPTKASSFADSLIAVRGELIAKVMVLGEPRTSQRPPKIPTAATAPPGTGRPPMPRAAAPGVPRPSSMLGAPARDGAAAQPSATGTLPRIIAIGSSTGGPEALARLLSKLPADLSVPVVIAQHMPKLFTRLLADRLNTSSRLTVVEATDNIALTAGTVTLATGGQHLIVVREGGTLRGRLTDTPPLNSCKPSIDVLFGSLPVAVGSSALTIVLTGMGADGAAGAAGVVAAGGRAWAQDEESSVVWGMPGSTVATGCVERVLPVERLADAIIATCGPSRGRTAVGATAERPR